VTGVTNENTLTGAEVWHSGDGTTWAQVNADGFGDSNNFWATSIAAFGDDLYVGTFNWNTGAELWRSSGIGGPPFTDWAQVNVDGFGDASNVAGIAAMTVFGGDLYVGTGNNPLGPGTGCEVWRSSDGTTWNQVNTDGFGDANNVFVTSLAIFGGNLYVGTTNWNTGAEVWSCQVCDGTDWTQVNADGFGGGNVGAASMAVFGGNLYVGTRNTSGAEVWNCQTCDGTDWTQVITGGFGDVNNDEVTSMIPFDGDLCAGTSNNDAVPSTSCEVWCSSDGANWTQVNVDGFGDPDNAGANTMAVFGDSLYIGTRARPIDGDGGQVWRWRHMPVGGVTVPSAGSMAMAPPTVGVGLVLGVAALGGAAWYARRRRS
jgi:tripartite motif-containing protein 71